MFQVKFKMNGHEFFLGENGKTHDRSSAQTFKGFKKACSEAEYLANLTDATEICVVHYIGG